MVSYINNQVLNFVQYSPMLAHYLFITFKIIMACICGGLIGYERETMNRPAGLRTHIIVCLGATLVMIISEIIFSTHKGLVNLDPARLGAQVISGIGFLGAGTIVKDGLTVKGLTTAASLWSVGCIGLAIGIGFYSGAIFTTILILFSLIIFKKIEDGYTKRKRQENIQLVLSNTKNLQQINSYIKDLFIKYKIAIKEISYLPLKDEKFILQLTVKFPFSFDRSLIPILFDKITGVENVNFTNSNPEAENNIIDEENYAHCDFENEEDN